MSPEPFFPCHVSVSEGQQFASHSSAATAVTAAAALSTAGSSRMPAECRWQMMTPHGICARQLPTVGSGSACQLPVRGSGLLSQVPWHEAEHKRRGTLGALHAMKAPTVLLHLVTTVLANHGLRIALQHQIQSAEFFAGEAQVTAAVLFYGKVAQVYTVCQCKSGCLALDASAHCRRGLRNGAATWLDASISSPAPAGHMCEDIIMARKRNDAANAERRVSETVESVASCCSECCCYFVLRRSLHSYLCPSSCRTSVGKCRSPHGFTPTSLACWHICSPLRPRRWKFQAW